MDDEQAPRELNAQISEAENDGNRDWLASILAPKLAFQRADEARTVDDRDAFLQKVQSGGKRKTLASGRSTCMETGRSFNACGNRRSGVPQPAPVCPAPRRLEAPRLG